MTLITIHPEGRGETAQCKSMRHMSITFRTSLKCTVLVNYFSQDKKDTNVQTYSTKPVDSMLRYLSGEIHLISTN